MSVIDVTPVTGAGPLLTQLLLGALHHAAATANSRTSHPWASTLLFAKASVTVRSPLRRSCTEGLGCGSCGPLREPAISEFEPASQEQP